MKLSKFAGELRTLSESTFEFAVGHNHYEPESKQMSNEVSSEKSNNICDNQPAYPKSYGVTSYYKYIMLSTFSIKVRLGFLSIGYC